MFLKKKKQLKVNTQYNFIKFTLCNMLINFCVNKFLFILIKIGFLNLQNLNNKVQLVDKILQRREEIIKI